MPLPQVRINPNGGPLSVAVVIGHAQIGAFQVSLYDAAGANPVDVGKGVNTDNIPDVFEVPVQPSELNRRILHWNIQVASPSGSPGERYSTEVRIQQDGSTVEGGVFTKDGALGDQAVQVTGMARLVVV